STCAMMAMLRMFCCSDIGCLSQCFVKHDTDCGGEVQAADVGIEDGNSQAVVPIAVQQILGQTACFRPENEAIRRLKRPVGVEAIGLRREIDETCATQRAIKLVEICVS